MSSIKNDSNNQDETYETKDVDAPIDESTFDFSKKQISYKQFCGLSEKCQTDLLKKAKRNFEVSCFNLITEEPFISNIFTSIRRVQDWRFDTAYITINEDSNDFVLGYNPSFFLTLTLNEIKGVIKHEIFHSLFLHLTSRRPYSQNDQSIANIAMDWAINSIIKKENLPKICLIPGEKFYRDETGVNKMSAAGKTVSEAFEEFQVSMPPLESFDFYFSKLRSFRNTIKKQLKMSGGCSANGDIFKIGGISSMDNHDIWDGISDEIKEQMKERMKDIIDKAVKKADSENGSSSWGTVPNEMKSYLRVLISKEIDWRVLLKQFLGRTKTTTKKSSRKNLNRRTPYLHPGYKSDVIADVAVFLDQSGSVSDSDLEMFFSELVQMSKLTTFNLHFFDTEIDTKNIVKWDRGKVIKPQRTRCGGTDFNAVANYCNLNQNIHKWNGVIILTDGYAPIMKKIHGNRKVLWVITENGTMSSVRKNDLCIKMKKDKKQK